MGPDKLDIRRITIRLSYHIIKAFDVNVPLTTLLDALQTGLRFVPVIGKSQDVLHAIMLERHGDSVRVWKEAVDLTFDLTVPVPTKADQI